MQNHSPQNGYPCLMVVLQNQLTLVGLLIRAMRGTDFLCGRIVPPS